MEHETGNIYFINLETGLNRPCFYTLGCTSDSDCRDPSARCNIGEGKCQNVLCPELNIPNSKIEKKDTLVAGDSVNVSKYFWVGSHGLLVNQLNLPRVNLLSTSKSAKVHYEREREIKFISSINSQSSI